MFLCSTAGGERWREPPFSGVSLDDVDVCYVLRIEVGPVLGFLVGYMMGRRMALLPLPLKKFSVAKVPRRTRSCRGTLCRDEW